MSRGAMAEICLISGEDSYQRAIPVADKGYLKIWGMLNQTPGTPARERWVPPWVFLYAGDDDQPPLRRADMPWFAGGALVVTRRAIKVLGEVLGFDAEMLPLRHDGEDLRLVNPWRQVDALDEENSVVDRFPSSGRVMWVRRYAFHEDKIGGLSCFMIPQLGNKMFVSGRVAEAARRAGLTGTTFPRAPRA